MGDLDKKLNKVLYLHGDYPVKVGELCLAISTQTRKPLDLVKKMTLEEILNTTNRLWKETYTEVPHD